MFLEKKSFNDFLTSPEGIASNILTNRLKSLINHKIIHFKINPLNKKVKWYYLTDKGTDTYPALIEMMKWSSRNLNNDFGPYSKIWIEQNTRESNKITSDKVISQYKIFRKKLFDDSKNHS
ncbi:MAG: HxlR family transcriptional regulator [Flavobacteriaceae bacterium]|nr:HxlR family transcriptional regulator [Flavobacteriaceae bacterium]